MAESPPMLSHHLITPWGQTEQPTGSAAASLGLAPRKGPKGPFGHFPGFFHPGWVPGAGPASPSPAGCLLQVGASPIPPEAPVVRASRCLLPQRPAKLPSAFSSTSKLAVEQRPCSQSTPFCWALKTPLQGNKGPASATRTQVSGRRTPELYAKRAAESKVLPCGPATKKPSDFLMQMPLQKGHLGQKRPLQFLSTPYMGPKAPPEPLSPLSWSIPIVPPHLSPSLPPPLFPKTGTGLVSSPEKHLSCMGW